MPYPEHCKKEFDRCMQNAAIFANPGSYGSSLTYAAGTCTLKANQCKAKYENSQKQTFTGNNRTFLNSVYPNYLNFK